MSTYQRTGKRIFFFTVFFMAVLLFAGKGNVQAKRKSVALNKTTVTAYKGMAPVKLKVKNVMDGNGFAGVPKISNPALQKADME